ncbi:hypothetical protein LY28_03205 [Ruminiclostridium sufflavum DSM 19573]|uniref:CBM-cenC domain-containing protein n=1 Tax=Ruminiclostridium sufflavum DSM 19573 TaxID=1121337 RepID=A0A318XGV8_9FIRM|nr:NTTRR-F1 domain [Ruminiclostridium sufflavum]PYG85785.1 hypothetical protein LY28_03205 [Ruminiclostridium sufflavum DSM 19573]
MAIRNLVVNGDFNTGSLSPWGGVNSSITTQYRHTGLFAVLMENKDTPSVISQTINGTFSEGFEIVASVKKTGNLPNPQVAVVLTYFDKDSDLLGTSLVLEVAEGSLTDNSWLQIYKTISPAPSETAYSILTVTKSVLEDSAEIVADDISLLMV